MKEMFMRQIVLVLIFVSMGIPALGCGDSEPKKVEDNPMKARQEAQKDKGGGKSLMPKGLKTDKPDK
jgi:hypothetical protein